MGKQATGVGISSIFGPTALLGATGIIKGGKGKGGTLDTLIDPMFNLGKQGTAFAQGKISGSDFLGSLDPVLIGPKLANINAQEESKENQLKAQMLQQQAAGSEQSIQRNKQLTQVLSQANAGAAIRGISVASGSFRAIQEESLQTGINADRVGKLNLGFKEDALRSQIDEVQRQASSDRFGAVFDSFKTVGEAIAFL